MPSIHRKTDSGRQALRTRQPALARPLRNLLLLVDGRRSDEQLLQLLGASGVDSDALAHLLELGLIEPGTAEGTEASRYGDTVWFGGAGEADSPPTLPPPADEVQAPAGAARPAPTALPELPELPALPELSEVLDMLEVIDPADDGGLPETVGPSRLLETVQPAAPPEAPPARPREAHAQQPPQPQPPLLQPPAPAAPADAAQPRRSMFARIGQGMLGMLQPQQDSPRQVSAGLAEVIKCAAVADAEFFSWLEAHLDELRGRETASVAHVVQRFPELRAQVEALDRQLRRSPSPLSFGSRLGGAIESLVGYGQYVHGEIVGLGMCLAATLGEDLGLQSASSAARLRGVLVRAGLPTRLPRAAAGRWLSVLPVDRPGPQGMLELVLLQDVARPQTRRVAPSAVLEALDRIGALSGG